MYLKQNMKSDKCFDEYVCVTRGNGNVSNTWRGDWVPSAPVPMRPSAQWPQCQVDRVAMQSVAESWKGLLMFCIFWYCIQGLQWTSCHFWCWLRLAIGGRSVHLCSCSWRNYVWGLYDCCSVVSQPNIIWSSEFINLSDIVWTVQMGSMIGDQEMAQFLFLSFSLSLFDAI